MREAARVLMVMALGLAAGCAASNAKRREQSDLQQLQRSLPGSYDSSARGADAAGAGTAQPVTLTIQPASAQLIGDAVYFVRETPSDNPRLVLEQRIWTLTLDVRGQIVQHMFLFKDPRRWTGAATDPDLLVSMLPQDLQPLSGCDLVWQHMQTDFTAAAMGLSQACHPGASLQGLWIAQQARLSGRQLVLTERRTGADGALDASEPALSLTLMRGSSASP